MSSHVKPKKVTISKVNRLIKQEKLIKQILTLNIAELIQLEDIVDEWKDKDRCDVHFNCRGNEASDCDIDGSD